MNSMFHKRALSSALSLLIISSGAVAGDFSDTDFLTIKLKGIRFEGNEVMSESTLAMPYSHLNGTDVNLGQLRQIEADIEKRHRKAGYFLTAVRLEPQEVKRGIITYTVINGFIDKISFQNQNILNTSIINENHSNTNVQPYTLLRYANNMIAEKPLTRSRFERYLTLIDHIILWWFYECVTQKVLLGENSERDPPDPIPNSEVKPLSADDSVGVPMWK